MRARKALLIHLFHLSDINVLCKCVSSSPVQHQISLKPVSVLQFTENHYIPFYFVVSVVYGEAQVYQSAQAFASHVGKRY